MVGKQKAAVNPVTMAEGIWHSPAIRKISVQAVFFMVGLLCSRGIVFGRYAPFGVAVIAAAPYPYLLSSVAGSFLGYLIPNAVQSPVRYIAALLAAGAIRWTLNDLIKVRRHPFFAPLISFCPLFATGMAMSFVDGTPMMGNVMYVAESMLSAGVSYFFVHMSEMLTSGKGWIHLKIQDLVSVTISLGVVILSFSDLSIAGISVGRMIAVLVILLAARYGGIVGGSVSGITAGVVLSLSTAGVNYLSGAYALGGLMAGIFSPAGRLASAVAFVFSNAVASLQVGDQMSVVNGLYEVMFATVCYMLWPARGGERLRLMFGDRSESSDHRDGLRRSVIMKLDFAAKALGNVSESVETVSKKLSSLCAPDINGVYKKAIDDTCRHCGLKVYCWEKNYAESMDAFNHLTQELRKGKRIEREDFPQQFYSHCSRIEGMVESVNRHYEEFIMRESAERRAAQIRSVVTEQFGTTAELLNNMAHELELFERFDFEAARQVGEVLRNAGIVPIDVSCRVDRFDRMSIEIETAQFEHAKLNRSSIGKQISRACGRLFETPCISFAQGRCRFQTTERPTYRILSGISQHVCGNSQLCGDSYECFPDGSGRQIAIISDGMGTGGRAAVDGAMAAGIMATLIKAGIGFDCALKIVNSALLVKSGDESLATIDLAVFDLFSGKVNFMKAGATISYVRKFGKAIKIDAPSLPVGILNEVEFSREDLELSQDDLIVLFSDGVTASGDDWIPAIIESWKGEVPQELAEKVLSEAIARRNDGHDDDITVIVMKIAGSVKELS